MGMKPLDPLGDRPERGSEGAGDLAHDLMLLCAIGFCIYMLFSGQGFLWLLFLMFGGLSLMSWLISKMTEGKPARSVFGVARWGEDATRLSAAKIVPLMVGKELTEGPYLGISPIADWRGRSPHVRYTGDGHLLMVAPSRSGKARDVLVPSLVLNMDSSVVLDIKGELAAMTAAARATMGHQIVCVNPFGMHTGKPWGLGQQGFNPLMMIDPKAPNLVSRVMGLADALITHEGNQSHWSDGARALVAGLMLHEIVAKGRSASLANVRQYITMSEDDFSTCVAGMVTHPFPVIRDKLAAFTGKMTNELRGFISTAKTQTEWLSDPLMQAAVSSSTFDFADLKTKPMTVYLMMPGQFASVDSTYMRFMRLLIQSAIDAVIAAPKVSKRPVWFLLDEFAALGALPAIERMMGLGAGYGLQLQPVVQNLTQLQDLYNKNWETFIGNASVKQFFAPADMTTADYISRMLGQFTAEMPGRGGAPGGQAPRPLLRPEEVMQIGGRAQIVFSREYPEPLFLQRMPYFEIGGVKDAVLPNPYQG